MNIEMNPVDSTSIEKTGYDEIRMVLAVKFHNGSLYHYLNVPEFEYDSFMNSLSSGTYLNTHIKPQYDFIKIEPH